MDPQIELAPPCRPQVFFLSTSCRMCRSSVRSATRRFSRAFSSRNCLSWRSSLTPRLPYFLFQMWNVASLTPSCRHTSATGTPESACRSAYVICSSANLDFFSGVTSLATCEPRACKMQCQQNPGKIPRGERRARFKQNGPAPVDVNVDMADDN